MTAPRPAASAWLLALVLGTSSAAAPRAVFAQATPAPATPAPRPAPSPGGAPAAPTTPPAAAPGAAAPAPPVAVGKPVAVSLREAIALTVANNLDLKVEAFNPEIQTANVGQEEAAFDPTLGTQVQASQDRSPSQSALQGTNTRTIAGQVTLSQRLPYGTQYELSYNTDRLGTNSVFASFNPSYSAEVLLTVTQPLLRNFGRDVNRTRIIVAQGNRRIAAVNFRRSVMDSLLFTVQNYWGLVAAQDALDVAHESLRLAQRLLAQNRIQVQVGTLAPIEVTQAEAGVASREEGVLVAQQNVADAEDRLKRALLIDPANAFDYTIVPADRPEFAPVEAQLAPNLEAALKLRPELLAAEIGIQNQEANVRLARNQTLAQLDVVGSAGLNGFDDSFGGAQKELGSEADNQYQWSAGLLFSYPLGNRAARNALTSQQLSLRQSQTSLRSLELQVTQDVRSAVRAVNTNIQRVRATREATRLAREQLTAEERRLAVGLSTSFEVLRLQTDLATARNNEIGAITDYRVSLVSLDRAVGTLLDHFDVTLAE